MTAFFAVGPIPPSCAVADLPSTRGRQYHSPAGFYSNARLSTDALGSMTLTLTNVVVGSRYRIERQDDGSLATPTANAEGVAASSTVAITLDYYSPGSANNNLRIKVRKGTSAPKFAPFETLATISAVAQSAYIAQVADPIA